MLGLFGEDKINGFGLDISESSIKIVQLLPGPEGLTIGAFAKSRLPDKVIVGHIITNPTKLAEAIQQTIAGAGKIDSHYVVVSVPEAKSFVRTIKLPKMTSTEAETAVPFELEQNIPIPIDQVYFDWQQIGETADAQEILVTASPKEYIDTLIDVLKTAKLKPLAFELESQACARALLDREDDNQTNLIIDISELQSSFLLVEKGNLQYTSSIPIGGAAFTESITRALNISAAEAEKIKIQSGLLESTKNANQAILPILDNILDEIRNVLKFYEEHYKNHLPLKQIVLCGGGSQVPGLVDYISVRLNLGSGVRVSKVVTGNPFRHLAAQAAQAKIEGLSYGTTIGLALRAINFKIDW